MEYRRYYLDGTWDWRCMVSVGNITATRNAYFIPLCFRNPVKGFASLDKAKGALDKNLIEQGYVLCNTQEEVDKYLLLQ
jgi:hypothetical protein